MTDEKNLKNGKQDLDILSLKKDIERLTDDMRYVKKQVANDLPHQIAALDKRITDETGKIKDRIFYGGIIGIISIIVIQILLKFF